MKNLFFIITILFFLQVLNAQTDSTKSWSQIVEKMTLEELLDIVISTAGKTEEKISEIPASVVIVTREEIEKYGYRTLQEVLENIPGIYVIDQYAHTDVTLGVRGFWSPSTKGVIIMVNGVSQLQDIYDHFPLNRVAVPVESIDRIEIIRGPMSVVYGSGSFYGAINIITNESRNNDRETGIVSASYGTDNYKKAAFNVHGGSEDFSFSLHGSMYETDGLDVDWNSMSSDSYFQTGTTSDFFARSSYYYSLSSSYKGFYADFNMVRDIKTWVFLLADKNHPNRMKNDFSNTRLGYKTTYSDFDFDFKLGYYFTNVQSGNTFPHDPDESWLDFSHWAIGSQSYDIEVNTVYTPSEVFNITIGLNYKKIMQSYELLNMPSLNYNDVAIWQPDENKLQSFGAFFQANWQVLSNLKLVAGLRMEKRGEGNNVWELNYGKIPTDPLFPYAHRDIPLPATKLQYIPRLALLYSINGNNVIKLLYGKAVRFPTYQENNDINSAPLKPEEINTIELNYIAALSTNLTVNFSAYKNFLSNLILRKEFFDENNNYVPFQSNAGAMNTNGMEISLKARPAENMNMDISFNYQATEDENHIGREVMNSPEILAYAKVSYSFDENFMVGISGNYVDKMVSQWDPVLINAVGTTGGRIGNDAPSYLNLGINFRYQNILDIEGLFANLKISNLLDSEIRYSTYSHSAWAEKGTLGISRTYMITCGYKF